ncbi:hypothetical protein R6Q59_008861 [Mikania micrantha]
MYPYPVKEIGEDDECEDRLMFEKFSRACCCSDPGVDNIGLGLDERETIVRIYEAEGIRTYDIHRLMLCRAGKYKKIIFATCLHHKKIKQKIRYFILYLVNWPMAVPTMKIADNGPYFRHIYLWRTTVKTTLTALTFFRVLNGFLRVFVQIEDTSRMTYKLPQNIAPNFTI